MRPKVTVTSPSEPATPRTRRRALATLTVEQIVSGALQEGQELDYKREITLDKAEGKARLLDDVVAFLNRGAGRIVVGVEEKNGRVDGLRPLAGDPDKAALRVQVLIQDGVTPLAVDVQVVPLHVETGYLLDIQIPHHPSGPFMNRLTGSYLIRSGARNLPIDPGMLRSRFVDEVAWMARLEELTAAEDARLAASGRVAPGQGLRIAILPREHFDHQRAAFAQDQRVRYPGPVFHPHSDPWFKAVEDGHELYARDMTPQGVERLLVRDDWFVHAQVAYALQETRGEGRLALQEFDEAFKRYLQAIADFFAEQEIEGPFAVTVALQSLGETKHFGRWFPNASTIRTLRPLLVTDVDDPELIADFTRRVRQASRYG